MDLSFFIPGTPKAQPRPRLARNGHAYTPDSVKPWKRTVTLHAKPRRPKEPLDGPVFVSLRFYLEKPKSNKSHAHIQKPDIDNLAKAVLDVLTQCGYWRDDSQIAEMLVSKSWATTESGVTVRVEKL